MGKTRRKERSEVEYYRGQIKALEKENRQLKKRVRALDKTAHFYEDLVDFIADDIYVPDEKCPICKTGKHQLLDLKYVRYMTCTECDYRKKL